MLYLLDPHDGVIELRIYGLQVFESRFLVQHSLVERQREAGVDELSVVQCLQGGFITLETTIRSTQEPIPTGFVPLLYYIYLGMLLCSHKVRIFPRSVCFHRVSERRCRFMLKKNKKPQSTQRAVMSQKQHRHPMTDWVTVCPVLMHPDTHTDGLKMVNKKERTREDGRKTRVKKVFR